MRRIASTTGIPAVLLLVLLSAIVRTESPSSVQAQTSPAIAHVALACVANNKFVTLTATVQPTTGIVYYIEAVTTTYSAARTPDALPQVLSEDECKQKDPKAAYFPGSDPK